MLDSSVSAFICIAGFFGLIFAWFQYSRVSAISLENSESVLQTLINNDEAKSNGPSSQTRLMEIYDAIREGARSFLRAEYKICTLFVVVFGLIVFILTSRTRDEHDKAVWKFVNGGLTALAFAAGAFTSMASGYLGMMVAVFANARTTVSATHRDAWTDSFNCAFRAGGVMGFSLCGLALLSLYALCALYRLQFGDDYETLFECVAGFGLGGSSIAMFGRVGGGIYTKAADVGADLAGKVVNDIPEDDPRNPATIADNVGDNVGDVAGMGSDLFGSFAEASCAALVVLANIKPADGSKQTDAMLMFPLLISAVGIFVCAVSSFVATNISPVKEEKDVEKVLKVQLAVTTILITAVLYAVAAWALPSEYYVPEAGHFTVPTGQGQPSVQKMIKGTPIMACACVWAGLWAGCAIGFITEYYTSHSYQPTREVAQSCETGAATNIIYGLALGYKSVILPVILLSIVVCVSFALLDMFGVALAALGMLSNLATCLSIDVYGPVCDNAGGIAEMAGFPHEVRDVTDALDAAGNTTAAIGKGFAIGSACLVGLALFGAFITRSKIDQAAVSILDPEVFAFLLIGAMIPYWFSALTMKSVGVAANEMVKEVSRQFTEIDGLLEGREGVRPDHAKCIAISTNSSLKEMIAPGLLVMSSPILVGVFFGSSSVSGLLAGAISSSIQMAISASNTGGAWDNAKKYVEKDQVQIWDKETDSLVTQGKGSDVHKAAVVGDTVGDPLKDTSGPALNIVMKLMAILSLVFADFFQSIEGGKGLIHWTIHDTPN